MSSQEQERKRIMRACAADVAGDPQVTFMEDVEERILDALEEACQAADAEIERLQNELDGFTLQAAVRIANAEADCNRLKAENERLEAEAIERRSEIAMLRNIKADHDKACPVLKDAHGSLTEAEAQAVRAAALEEAATLLEGIGGNYTDAAEEVRGLIPGGTVVVECDGQVIQPVNGGPTWYYQDQRIWGALNGLKVTSARLVATVEEEKA